MIKDKLSGQSGESIGETLVALLIAALALVMLAGAISASLGVVNRGREKIGAYYTANETINKRNGSGSYMANGITITDSSSNTQQYSITYYNNGTFSNKPVVAYKYS